MSAAVRTGGSFASGYGDRPAFDERDAKILEARQVSLDERAAADQRPRSGDFVIFADGVTRRVSHVWDWEASDDGPAVYDCQTSDCGSWYLGVGYADFSGGLFGSVPASTMTLTEERREGRCWFFHHDYAGAHCGVDALALFRVYTCSEEAPQ